MPKYVYRGRAYRQALSPDAPLLVSFVAPAEQIMDWAGVPRRSEQNRAGFQRMEDSTRIQRAAEFFQQPENQSPTAIIVGLHGDSHGDERVLLSLEEEEGDTTGSRPCTLTITWDPPSDLDQAISVVRRQFQARLESSSSNGDADQGKAEPGLDEIGEPEELDREGDDLAPYDAEADDEEGDEESEDDDELELGQSIIAQLLKYLDDGTWREVPENAAAVMDLSKPATIIDGQHRVIASASQERNIPFSVIALVDCPWPEQVFQFTVVNYTAKGIPDQFITANAALSLTGEELGVLKTRLVQANVKIKEYDLMRVVNFDSRSPFAGRINLTESRRSDLIGYKTMVRVANQWFDAKHQVFNMILPRLYPGVKGKGKKTRWRQEWRQEDWGEFFLAFWTEVERELGSKSSHIPGKTLWDVGYSQLMVAVVLLEFQSIFLENLNAQDEDYFDVSGDDLRALLLQKVRSRATKYAKFFPPEFFATNWGIKSLNTGSGRKDLQTCLKAIVDAKGAYNWASDRLVTGG